MVVAPAPQREVVGPVRVVDVDVEEAAEGLALGVRRDHDHRVAEMQPYRPPGLDVARGTEDPTEELDQPGHVGDDQSRGHAVVAGPGS